MAIKKDTLDGFAGGPGPGHVPRAALPSAPHRVSDKGKKSKPVRPA